MADATTPTSGERSVRFDGISDRNVSSERSTMVSKGATILSKLFRARSLRKKGGEGFDDESETVDSFDVPANRKTRTRKKAGKSKGVADLQAEEEQRQRELQESLNVSERGYLPVHVRTKLLELNGLPPTPYEEGARGVVLFADISGFTNLGKELRAKMPALEAASKLANRICTVLRELTDICHEFEGDVAKFAGDAVMCVWEKHDDQWMLERAKACAVSMLIKIKELDSQLDLHGGIAMGNILHFHLGDKRQELLWYLVTGDAVVRAANLVDAAPRGEILYEPRKDAEAEAAAKRASNGSTAEAPEASSAAAASPVEMKHPPLQRLPSVLDCERLTKDSKTMIVPVARKRKSLEDDEMPLSSPTDHLGHGRRLSQDAEEPLTPSGGGGTRMRTSTEDDPFLNMRITPRGRSYIPRALKNILMSGRIESGEMRTRVVTLFAALPSLVLSEAEIVKNSVAEDRKRLLNDTFAHISTIIRQMDGAFRDLLFDDKGCIFIAVFGAYSAVEMPELKALKAARRMEEELEVVDLKIGLSVGTCFVGLVGNDVRHDMIVMGHEVNMAARYMAKAMQATILVSSRFKQTTEEFFEFEPVRVELKKKTQHGDISRNMSARRFEKHENDLTGDGADEARRGSEFAVNDPNGTVLAYRPTKERQRRGSEISSYRYLTLIPDDCFVGRKAELNKLQGHFTKASTAKLGSFCMVSGPRGYGKSWLLREYRHRVDDKFASAMGVAFELNLMTPLYVFKQIFERFFEVADGLPEKQAKKVLSQWSAAGVKPDLVVLGKLFPHLVKIVNPPPAPRRVSTMPTSGMFTRMLGSMRFNPGQLAEEGVVSGPEATAVGGTDLRSNLKKVGSADTNLVLERVSSGAATPNGVVEEIRVSSGAPPTRVLSGASPKLEPVTAPSGSRRNMMSMKNPFGEKKGSSRTLNIDPNNQMGALSLQGTTTTTTTAAAASAAPVPAPAVATATGAETAKKRMARNASRPEMNLVMGSKEFEPVFKFISGLLELASNDAVKAGKKGLIIILEDLQWMDAVSLQVMIDLFDKQMANPKSFLPNVYFMASCRNADPDKPEEEYYGSSQSDMRPILEQRFLEKVQAAKTFQLVELDVLTRDEVDSLLNKILIKGTGDTVSEEVLSMIYNNSGGMPNAVADIIALIRQNEAIYLDPHANSWKWKMTSKNGKEEGGQSVLREARQAFVLRIDNLSLATKDLLKIAACVSTDKHKFGLHDVSDVIKLDLENKSRYLRADTHVPSLEYISSKLQEAVSAGLLKYRRAGLFNPLEEWAFSSHAICESVLDMVPTDRLKEIRGMKHNIEKEKGGQAAEGLYRDFFGGT